MFEILLPLRNFAGRLVPFAGPLLFILNVLSAVVAAIGSFFVGFLSPVVARQLTIISLVTGIALATIFTINAAVYSLVNLLDAQYINIIAMIIPPHFSLCIGLLFGAYATRWVFIWQHYFIRTVFS